MSHHQLRRHARRQQGDERRVPAPARADGIAHREFVALEHMARVGQRMGFSARLVPMPQAEAAIDVDKVSDHEQVNTIFTGRG